MDGAKGRNPELRILKASGLECCGLRVVAACHWVGLGEIGVVRRALGLGVWGLGFRVPTKPPAC